MSIPSHLSTRSKLATVARSGDAEAIRRARENHAAAMLLHTIRRFAPGIRGEDRIELARELIEAANAT